MNVLHVNNVDLYGRRFNGYDLIVGLPAHGVQCTQAVLTKLSRNPRVFRLMEGRSDEYLQGALTRIEKRRSMNNLLYPWGRRLAKSVQFAQADVIHYHLIHNQMISLLDLPWLCFSKPSVWTFHDPWPLTGHCIYPMECEGWKSGCSSCPTLDAVFPMSEDHADRMWRLKRHVYADLDIDIVVASQMMLDLVRRSPLTSHLERVHLIPFGIDASAYHPDSERERSREMLGIRHEDFVALFRATTSEFKGLRYIIEALGVRSPRRRTTLIAVDQRNLLRELSADYNVLDMGWVEDPSLYPHLFSACDVFLMPSTAEAFGLMALEAMAAGRPVVCFEGTSLPSVIHAPECGIAVPMANTTALREALDRLADNPEEARRRGELGRHLARTVYDHSHYLESLSNLYKTVRARHQAGNDGRR